MVKHDVNNGVNAHLIASVHYSLYIDIYTATGGCVFVLVCFLEAIGESVCWAQVAGAFLSNACCSRSVCLDCGLSWNVDCRTSSRKLLVVLF